MAFQKAYFEKEKRRKRQKISFPLIAKVAVFIGVLVIGGLLTLSIPIKNNLVSSASDTSNHSIMDVTREEVVVNEEDSEEAEYDFAEVKELDLPTVVKASTKAKETQKKIVAGIAIPSVGISESIYKGVSNNVLAIGAGTMKRSQEMGKGNYALAGHTMNNKSLLFGRLVDVVEGDNIYLTDKEYVYTYQVSYKGKVSAKDVHVIEDQEGRTMLTLVTCSNKGKKRLIVQADYVGKTSIEETSSTVLKQFQ